MQYTSQIELREHVAGMVAKLPSKEAYVITRRFGLDGKGIRNQATVADELGFCSEVRAYKRRVNYLRKSALNRLRVGNHHTLDDEMGQCLEVEEGFDDISDSKFASC
jgi:DNA-directed RNA polymerase sigma subunit (sigma70/sigma32)